MFEIKESKTFVRSRRAIENMTSYPKTWSMVQHLLLFIQSISPFLIGSNPPTKSS